MKHVKLTVIFIAMMFPSVLFAQSQDIKFVVSKFEAQFYGYLKFDMIYDDSETFFGNINFWANPENVGNDDQFNFTANQTRFGFSVKGPGVFGGAPKGVIEMDFYGGGNENTPNPRLYRAFLEVKWPSLYILIGQDWDTHSTLYPTCLNFGYLATAGNIQYRRPQLRIVKSLQLTPKSSIKIASAIARTIASDLDGFGINDGDDAGFPTYEGRISYENRLFANVPLTLAFSGHYGQEEVDWTGPGADIKYSSWSLNSEFIIPLLTFAYLKGEFFYGSNLDAYFGGISQGINSTTRKAIKARGGWLQMTMNISRPLKINLGGGVDRTFKSHVTDGDRYQNIVAYGNAYYSLTDNLTAAFEYSHFRTHYKNSSNGDDNRFHTAFIYSF